jgi:hypothetical protein
MNSIFCRNRTNYLRKNVNNPGTETKWIMGCPGSSIKIISSTMHLVMLLFSQRQCAAYYFPLVRQSAYPDVYRKRAVMKPCTAIGLSIMVLCALEASAGSRPDSAVAAKPASDTAAPVVSAPQAVAGTAAAPAFARCSVLTVPAEALVYIDDSLRGKSPVFVDSLKPGKHNLSLKKKGYFVKKTVINLEAGADSTVSFELPKPARLAVVTDPAGAIVHFDAADSCTAPCADDKLKPGTYVVEVVRPGFISQKDTMNLASGATDSLHVRLKPAGMTAAKSEGSASKGVTRALISLAVFVVFAVVVLIVETNH